MEYIVIGICLIAIVAIGARIFFKPKSKATVTPTVSVSPKEDEELSLSAPQGESAHDLVIQVEMLPAEAISEEGSLVEIDRKSTRLNSSHRLESRMPSSA